MHGDQQSPAKPTSTTGAAERKGEPSTQTPEPTGLPVTHPNLKHDVVTPRNLLTGKPPAKHKHFNIVLPAPVTDQPPTFKLERPRRHPLLGPTGFHSERRKKRGPHYCSMLASEVVADIYRHASPQERAPMTSVIFGRTDKVLRQIQLEILEDIILTMSRKVYAHRHLSQPTHELSPREETRLAQWEAIKKVHSRCTHCTSIYVELQIAYALDAALNADASKLKKHLNLLKYANAQEHAEELHLFNPSASPTAKSKYYAQIAITGGRCLITRKECEYDDDISYISDDDDISDSKAHSPVSNIEDDDFSLISDDFEDPTIANVIEIEEMVSVVAGIAYDDASLAILARKHCFSDAKQIASNLTTEQLATLRTNPKPNTIGWVLNALEGFAHVNSPATESDSASTRWARKVISTFREYSHIDDFDTMIEIQDKLATLDAHSLLLSDDITTALIALDDHELLRNIIGLTRYASHTSSVCGLSYKREQALFKNLERLQQHYVNLTNELATSDPEGAHQAFSNYLRLLVDTHSDYATENYKISLAGVPAHYQIRLLQEFANRNTPLKMYSMDIAHILKTCLEANDDETREAAQNLLNYIQANLPDPRDNPESFSIAISTLTYCNISLGTSAIASLITDQQLDSEARQNLSSEDALNFCREPTMTELTPSLMAIIHAVDDPAALVSLQRRINELMNTSNFDVAMKCNVLIMKKTRGYEQRISWEEQLEHLKHMQANPAIDFSLSRHGHTLANIWLDIVAGFADDDIDISEYKTVSTLPKTARNHPCVTQFAEAIAASFKRSVSHPPPYLLQQLPPLQLEGFLEDEDKTREEHPEWFSCQRDIALQTVRHQQSPR